MFIGLHARTLDKQFRFKLPRSFIDNLKTGATAPRSMLFAPGEAMRVYSDKGYEALVSSISALEDDARARMLLRTVIARSERVAFTRFGRVKIPRRFIEYFGFERGGNIMLAGCYDYFEIWDEARWKAAVESAEITPEDLARAE